MMKTMNFRTIIPYVYAGITVAVVMSLSGCMAPIKYKVSVPQQIPAGMSGKIKDETITLDTNKFTLSIQVQAYDWGGQYLLRPLGVWLRLQTKDGVMSLDPQKVTLQTDQSSPLQAVSFLGPDTPWQSPRALSAGCGPRFYRTGIGITRIGVSQESVMEANAEVGIHRPTAGPVSFEGDKCFMFWFDTDSKPNHVFVLTVDGLSINQQPVKPVKLQFKKGTVVKVKGFP